MANNRALATNLADDHRRETMVVYISRWCTDILAAARGSRNEKYKASLLSPPPLSLVAVVVVVVVVS